jgi:hypothetical protein
MTKVTITVTLEEAVAIVNLIGNLPTNQNAHLLWVKLREQVEPHLTANATAPEPVTG